MVGRQDRWRREDRVLLDELRSHAQRVDAPDPVYLGMAKSALRMRGMDAELAELLYDSDLAPVSTVSSARADGHRSLSFEHGGTTVDLEIADGTVAGRVGGLEGAAVELQVGSVCTPVPVDQEGRFMFAPGPPGPFSLILHCPGPTLVVTEWIVAS